MQAPVRLPTPPSWVSEFKAFLLRGNVVDLAVGIVIGAAFTGVVSSLVKDVFTPVLGLIAGGVDFSNLFITLKGEHAATLEAAQRAGAVTINIGLFLNAVLSFLIISFVIFWVVKLMNRFKAKEAEVPAALSKTEHTLIEIRDLLAQGSSIPGQTPGQ
ncbi:MAG: large-conductance mechanosensitive channel protein MscL [Acetobacteraceae bacterium]|nr:large-conductance mechanosensitive channel protein MscL [Acetobacteraceae bacterium]